MELGLGEDKINEIVRQGFWRADRASAIVSVEQLQRLLEPVLVELIMANNKKILADLQDMAVVPHPDS
jgi:hypothetical protein